MVQFFNFHHLAAITWIMAFNFINLSFDLKQETGWIRKGKYQFHVLAGATVNLIYKIKGTFAKGAFWIESKSVESKANTISTYDIEVHNCDCRWFWGLLGFTDRASRINTMSELANMVDNTCDSVMGFDEFIPIGEAFRIMFQFQAWCQKENFLLDGKTAAEAEAQTAAAEEAREAAAAAEEAAAQAKSGRVRTGLGQLRAVEVDEAKANALAEKAALLRKAADEKQAAASRITADRAQAEESHRIRAKFHQFYEKTVATNDTTRKDLEEIYTMSKKDDYNHLWQTSITPSVTEWQEWDTSSKKTSSNLPAQDENATSSTNYDDDDERDIRKKNWFDKDRSQKISKDEKCRVREINMHRADRVFRSNENLRRYNAACYWTQLMDYEGEDVHPLFAKDDLGIPTDAFHVRSLRREIEEHNATTEQASCLLHICYTYATQSYTMW